MKTGPPSELERERGRKVSVWIRQGMLPPHQPVELSNRDVARMTGMSPSMIGYYVSDCFDRNEDRMKYPSEDAIRKIAAALHISAEEGLSARFWRENSALSTNPIARVPEDSNDVNELDPEIVELYSGADPADRELVKSILRRAQERERKATIGGRRADEEK